MSVWNVDSSEKYDAWFETLDEESKEAVLERVLLLRHFGPNLPRPYSDVLHGAKKHKNLKELRNQTLKYVLRVAYYFDSERNAFLLTGGDKMSPKSVRQAHIKAEQDIMTIRLAQLREELNVKQSEMTNFTQSSVSKIEKRKDIKISTLIDYLDSLGMGLEIITYPKISVSNKQEKILLKV